MVGSTVIGLSASGLAIVLIASGNVCSAADGRTEKNTRSALKAAVEKSVNATDIVVLDALNYIKGVRYELFCKARAESTTYCVVRLARSIPIGNAL